MAFAIKNFEQILADMLLWISVHSPQLSDLTPGSIVRSFCEATALVVEEVYTSALIGFLTYLEDLRVSIFDFSKKTGTKAMSSVVFSRSVAGDKRTIIAGTRIKTASGYVFQTMEETFIDIGNTASAAALVEAVAIGIAYNVAAHQIVQFDTPLDGVDFVDNAVAASGGTDVETNDAYLKRFQDYIEGLGKSNVAGLRSAALSVTGITSASVVERIPAVANVNVDVYADNGAAAGTTVAQVAAVQLAIDGDGTEQNPGARAAGVNVVAHAASLLSQNIEMTVYKSTTVVVDEAVLATDLQQVITWYLSSLGVGNDIIHVSLAAACLSVYGVRDIVLTTPAGNVTVADNQAARPGTFTFHFV